MTDAVKKSLKEMRINNALILGGGTNYIQAPDVLCNKPFKGSVMEFYDEWLASGVHFYIETGYGSLHHDILFKPGPLTLKDNDSAGNIIHCFKSEQPCSEGASLLSL